jgi:hypothetical protein
MAQALENAVRARRSRAQDERRRDAAERARFANSPKVHHFACLVFGFLRGGLATAVFAAKT